jgi:hypothetical protein
MLDISSHQILSNMSDTLFYIVVSVVVLHFVVGFGYLLLKLNAPVDKDAASEEEGK